MKSNNSTIWSIGHSNRPVQTLINLLNDADIETVIDCRTKPRSRWPQFNGSRLAEYLADDDITYEFWGNNLGGLAGNVDFKETLDEMADRAKKGERITLLCSEGNPKDCHRGTVLAPELVKRDITVEHLLYA